MQSFSLIAANIATNDILLKLDSLACISVAESVSVSSTTFMQYASKITEFGEITQYKAVQYKFKVIQGHWVWYQSKAHVYNFLLVINTNLDPILYRFRDIAFPSIGLKSLYLAIPLAFNLPRRRGSLERSP